MCVRLPESGIVVGMDVGELLVDAFGRVGDATHRVLDGASPAMLVHRPDPHANSIAWLVWHLARI